MFSRHPTCFTAFTWKLKESVLRIVRAGSGWIIGLAHVIAKQLTAQLSRTAAKSKKWYWKPRLKQTMNKIYARSISVYTRQMVGLQATSEICGIAVGPFMLFCDGYKVETSSIYTSMYHSGKLSSRSNFSFRDLFSSFLLLVLSFFYSFSSFFLSFPLSFRNKSYCFILYYKKHKS